MGVVAEQNIWRAVVDSQKSTDAKLDRLIAAQDRTNQLLEWLGSLLAEKQPA